MITLNQDLLKAKVFHSLKSLQSPGDTLPPRVLEIAVCDAFGFKHVGDSNYYADGVCESTQISIKTRMISPESRTRKDSRDFHSHPEKFLGPKLNKKQNKWINGLEIVQRRQQLNLENDSTADPQHVGKETLLSFRKNIEDSYTKYSTNTTYEVILVHGYDRTNNYYILSVFCNESRELEFEKIFWLREGYGVSGYIKDSGVDRKIYERVNGNAKREATCFKEYKDLVRYQNCANIKVPLPDLWPFEEDKILEEIRQKELRIQQY